MTTLELQKMADRGTKRHRYSVSTAPSPVIRADLYLQQTYLPISILKR